MGRAVFYANVLIGGSQGSSDADSEHRPIADWYTSYLQTVLQVATATHCLHCILVTKHLYSDAYVELSDRLSDRAGLYIGIDDQPTQ